MHICIHAHTQIYIIYMYIYNICIYIYNVYTCIHILYSSESASLLIFFSHFFPVLLLPADLLRHRPSTTALVHIYIHIYRHIWDIYIYIVYSPIYG